MADGWARPGLHPHPAGRPSGRLSRALCLRRGLWCQPATAGTESRRRDTDTDTCLLMSSCFCLACVVGASLFTLQTWQCMAKGCKGPQGVADQVWGQSQGGLVHWSLEA